MYLRITSRETLARYGSYTRTLEIPAMDASLNYLRYCRIQGRKRGKSSPRLMVCTIQSSERFRGPCTKTNCTMRAL